MKNLRQPFALVLILTTLNLALPAHASGRQGPPAEKETTEATAGISWHQALWSAFH